MRLRRVAQDDNVDALADLDALAGSAIAGSAEVSRSLFVVLLTCERDLTSVRSLMQDVPACWNRRGPVSPAFTCVS